MGSTLILYDGSPFYPDPGAMFQLAQDEGMSLFGTSARYIASVEKAGLIPKEKFDLSRLKVMTSTASPLSEESFRFVYSSNQERYLPRFHFRRHGHYFMFCLGLSYHPRV